jgi:hypothetical protein
MIAAEDRCITVTRAFVRIGSRASSGRFSSSHTADTTRKDLVLNDVHDEALCLQISVAPFPLPSFGSSPFSKGFDFAKNISVPQQERRRPSMVNITYDFEKGLEARPRYERSKSRSKYASADSNLIGGLKAFGAKDHDIRRLLA